jgi:hypothetical protein
MKTPKIDCGFVSCNISVFVVSLHLINNHKEYNEMENIAKYLKLKEETEVEYKSAKGGFPGSFWETFSAFANTQGGVIVLGMKEKNGKFTPDGLTEEQLAAHKKGSHFIEGSFWELPNSLCLHGERKHRD